MLGESMVRIPASDDFATRLAVLRREYEPYAQALADHLLLTLPPWIRSEPRRDNWQSGPWDRALGTHPTSVVWDEEHF
jgi:hypothetical protein